MCANDTLRIVIDASDTRMTSVSCVSTASGGSHGEFVSGRELASGGQVEHTTVSSVTQATSAHRMHPDSNVDEPAPRVCSGRLSRGQCFPRKGPTRLCGRPVERPVRGPWFLYTALNILHLPKGRGIPSMGNPACYPRGFSPTPRASSVRVSHSARGGLWHCQECSHPAVSHRVPVSKERSLPTG